MDALILGGGDKAEAIKQRLKQPFLLIDDGPVIDALAPKKALHFDPTKHTLNVLEGMDYYRACDFVTLLDAVYPYGENTLRRMDATFLLLNALCANPQSFEALVPDGEDPAVVDARQKIERLLLSPTLKSVLAKPTNFDISGTIVARLDRRKLRDFDAFFLAHLLVMQYPGQVVIPDFGFYGRAYWSYLMREERLICGVHTLAELSDELSQSLLLFEDKVGVKCTAEDAAILASYRGLFPHTQGHIDFIRDVIS